MSRDVRGRYRDLLDELRPGFWTEMADELRNMFVRHITFCSGEVREFPAQEAAGVRVVASTRDAATTEAVETGREAATQAALRDRERRPDSSTEDWEGPVVVSVGQPSGAETIAGYQRLAGVSTQVTLTGGVAAGLLELRFQRPLGPGMPP